MQFLLFLMIILYLFIFKSKQMIYFLISLEMLFFMVLFMFLFLFESMNLIFLFTIGIFSSISCVMIFLMIIFEKGISLFHY